MRKVPVVRVPHETPMHVPAPDGRLSLHRTWMIFFERLHAIASDPSGVYGTHAERLEQKPDTIADGTLWVETDRGNALYHFQAGLWWYVAGTMFGTLDPDQRPSDLGVNDVGFHFRTNVTPAREFIWSDDSWIEVTPVRYGTHAERLAQPADLTADGTLWVETDRDNVVCQLQDSLWRYLTGTMRAPLAGKPADLGTNDTGFLFYGTDYCHTWRWTGTGWIYADGDECSGFVWWWAQVPPSSRAGAWQLADGSTVTKTTATAGTASITVPNVPPDPAHPGLIAYYRL